MKKSIYSVLVLLPLTLLFSGVAGLLPDRVVGAHFAGVPISIWLILTSLVWSVVIAWVYLRYEDREEGS